MSRSRNQRGRNKRLNKHRRNVKEWGVSKPWKPAERAKAPKKTRSKRRRSGDCQSAQGNIPGRHVPR